MTHWQRGRTKVTEAPASRFDIIRGNPQGHGDDATRRARLVDLTCRFSGGWNADVWIA